MLYFGKITFVALSILLVLSCEKPDRARLIIVGVSHGPGHSQTLAFTKFREILEQRSGGRYRVRVYHSATLGDEKQMQELLTIGSAEMTVTGLLNIYEPLFALFEMPYLYRDREHVTQVNTGPIMDEVAASLLPNGIRLIGFYENGYRNVTTSKQPINRPEDLRGLMIRTPENPAQIATFNTLGAIATPMPFSELYTALLQGVVDGQENPLQQIYLSRLYEAQKYCAITQHIYNSAYVLISERFWQSLSADDQLMIQACVRASSEWQLNYMRTLDVELEKKIKETGMEFTYPDQELFRKACLPAYEAIYEKLGPKAKKIVEKIRATR
ncbi:TRAP transporter substrate-binding protein [candidate division KSB1 bacterium]|nr:TRAP transporter substrate-binding protein [candidate division KSB1 bacterium]